MVFFSILIGWVG